MLIKDTAQKIRANRPTKRGMHPAVEARLQRLGVDPDARARVIALSRETSPTRGLPTRALDTRPGAPSLNLALDPSDVRVRPLLNRAALFYKNDALLADEVAPIELTDERSAQYQIWGRDDDLEGPEDEIGPTGSAKEVSPTLSDDNFSVRDYALKGAVSRDTEMANPSLGLRARVAGNVKNRMMLRREVRVADVFLATGTYPSTNRLALSSGAEWNGGASADPIADFLGAMEAITGVDVTDAVMSDLVWHAAVQNDLLKAILASQYNNEGLLQRADFGLYFGIKNVRVSKAVKKNAAGNRVRIWGDGAVWLGYVDATPGALTFARSFRLRQGAGGFVTKILPKEDAGVNGVEFIRVAYSEDTAKVVAPTYGYLITGARQ